MENYILTFMIFLPMAGALAVLVIPKAHAWAYKWVALATTAAQLVLSLMVFSKFNSLSKSYQMVQKHDWITLGFGNLGQLSIEYHLGVDGFSLLMVLLSGIVLTIGAVASWHITANAKGYFALYLILAGNIMGCFLALDMFLFFLFFEFMLLPMYFLIGLWGGKRSAYASIKFYLYTLVGSLMILVVLIGLYLSVIDPVKTGDAIAGSKSNLANNPRVQELLAKQIIHPHQMVRTFNMPFLEDDANYIPGAALSKKKGTGYGAHSFRYWAFLLLFVGFAIKLPIVPLHTWLPDAHVEAPTAISVVLAGILLKIGGYGFFRFAYTLFPEGAHYFGFYIAALGVLAIIYGGLNAMAQKDLKKLIAYSSVSHMGFVLLGLASLTSEGAMGAMLMMFSHGLTSSASFLVAGVIYDRTHDRLIENYSGLASKMPYFSFLTVAIFFASLGLPGFSGFVAELFTFLGAFTSGPSVGIVPMWLAIVSLLGLLIGAAYYLWVLQRMFFGKYWVRDPQHDSAMTDITNREWAMLLPLVLLSLLVGILPMLITSPISATLNAFVMEVVKQGKANLELFNTF